MNKIALGISSLLLSGLLGGCVGTGPNTQQGAVTGGALGAIAGAVIGHNSRDGDAVGGAILGGTAGAIAGGAIGNSVDHQQGTIYGEPEPRRVYRTARVESGPPPPPPTPTEAIPPAPAPNAIWVPGYWIYDGRYSWVAGRWEVPPPYARSYVAAHWENRGGHSVFVQGYWQ